MINASNLAEDISHRVHWVGSVQVPQLAEISISMVGECHSIVKNRNPDGGYAHTVAMRLTEDGCNDRRYGVSRANHVLPNGFEQNIDTNGRRLLIIKAE